MIYAQDIIDAFRADIDRLRSELATKDARLVEADKEIKKWQDEAIRQGYRQWLDDNEALRKELAEAKAAMEATTMAMDAAYEVGGSGVWRKDFYKEKARAEQAEARITELETAGKELHACLTAMVDRWEPDTEGLDRVMRDNSCEALGRDIWAHLKTT